MMKNKKQNSQCKRTGHTLRFVHYIGERDFRYPSNHVKYTPKHGLFKCCNCKHEEIRQVRIRYSRPPLIGEEVSGGGFFFFRNRDE